MRAWQIVLVVWFAVVFAAGDGPLFEVTAWALAVALFGLLVLALVALGAVAVPAGQMKPWKRT